MSHASRRNLALPNNVMTGRMKPYQLLPLLLVLLLLTACGAAGDEIVFAAAPWQDGETSEYDVISAQGERVGTAVWQWHTSLTGWQQTYTVTLPSRVDSGVMLLGHDLLPQTSEMARGGAAYATTYEEQQITIITTTAGGTASSRTLNRSGPIIDNDQSLQVQRALPLADGYAAHYRGLVANTGAQFSTNLRVVGAENVTTPAGTFETWHVTMTTAGATHDAWYGQEPPHLLVKYHNRSAGSQFQLRRWQETAVAPWQGSPDDTFVPETPAETAAAKVNYLLVAVMLLFQFPLMILFPLLLGGWIKRRFGISWTVFGVGALTFILSQVGHLPFNWATGLLTGGWGIGLWPLPLLALAAGLSAGLFEEVARWLVLRYWLKQARGWPEALQFGAGHGGMEAIIFGLLVVVNLVAMLALTTIDLAALGVPPGDAATVQAGVVQFWQTPWYLSALAGLERLFAIAFHIAMAVLIMRGVMRGQITYLLAAIAAHTAFNFWAVWGAATVGPVWTEVGLAIMAAGCLGLIVWLQPSEKPERIDHDPN
jgi:uncharacterized membrane protein YhfC